MEGRWTPGRYRWRTRLRGALPLSVSRAVPKGRRDCGNHQWYRASSGEDRCYHCDEGVRRGDEYEIEFRWKELVIYWEGPHGAVFPGGWGVEPVVTIVPDVATWDRAVPDWLRGRHDEVVARLRADERHVVHEERDDSVVPRAVEEITR